jgi:hypothetical protein
LTNGGQDQSFCDDIFRAVKRSNAWKLYPYERSLFEDSGILFPESREAVEIHPRLREGEENMEVEEDMDDMEGEGDEGNKENENNWAFKDRRLLIIREFFSRTHGLAFWRRGTRASEFTPSMGDEFFEPLLKEVLEGYANEPNGSWKHELFLAKESLIDLVDVIRDGGVWVGAQVRVLQFSPSCTLWNEKLLLGTPL